MSLPSLEYLRHILDETAYLTDRAKGLGKDEFMQDETLKRAFVRSVVTNKVPMLQQEIQQIIQSESNS